MNKLLNAQNTGVPLTIIEKSTYSAWQSQQTQCTQTWLAQTNFSGDGLALIPHFSAKLQGELFSSEKWANKFVEMCNQLINEK